MENCTHQWISNSGSNDKPCVYCNRYPVLKLRYRCNNCINESCRFCLIDLHQLPPETSQADTNSRGELFTHIDSY